MAVDSKHPLYLEFNEDWTVMRDTHRGERIIKEKGSEYLPPTSGMTADGMVEGQPGRMAYDAYKLRAKFPDIVKQSVAAMIGVMHHKPAVFELPEAMEPMLEKATNKSESLDVLLRRINEHQLITGRCGLLLDVPNQAPVGTLPYISLYAAKRVLNWDDGKVEELVAQNLNFVSLDETEHERKQDFEWELEEKYRVLILGDPKDNEPKGQGVYRAAIFNDSGTTFTEARLVTPSIAGRTLDKIPFEFINSKDVVPEPDDPPLLGLAKLALTIYRGEADYRQALFMQGQDTLVVSGESDPDKTFRTGANAAIILPTGGKAEFIGVDSSGLSEMRQALENDRLEAGQSSGQLIETASRERESGEALRIRVAARTASLNQIALAGAFGLQSILRTAAVWTGNNPEEVKVTPNLDFAAEGLEGKTLVEYMTAKSMGAPYSLRSIHDQMREKDLTTMTFEEELEEINDEQDLAGVGNDDLEDEEDGGQIEEQEEETEPTEEGGTA